MIRETQRDSLPGIPLLIVFPTLLLLDLYWFITTIIAIDSMGKSVPSVLWLQIIGSIVFLIILIICLCGFFMVDPNEGRVLQLFGAYRGTARLPGLRWANPFFSKHSISMRVRNFETRHLKVNDKRGNPIEIAAVVVWKVVDSAQASFHVDNFENYVNVQSEAALRGLATAYPYDGHVDGEIALISHLVEISQKLRTELQERLSEAGVEVQEARISHLAYAQEIAATMLRRQQANAVIAARSKIVEGAVGMVEHALEMLAQKKMVELDEERKAAMVSNLLVVLCSEQNTQPIVNAGTLY